jgi:uncharacterized protein with ParB-like and HNH nuclease domain
MQAKETKLQDILEGTKQYVVPLFQRTYSWEKKHWEILWDDLYELYENEKPRSHFIGSIVTMPMVSVPEGVSKFSLIDGQQRLTTIFIILTLLRDKSIEEGDNKFAAEINNTLLVNFYKKDLGLDYFKLIPTQIDRDAYSNLIQRKQNTSENQITRAYTFFEKKLRRFGLEYKKLKEMIISYLSVVSIVLDPEDNPHLVFESLNFKGKPLTQADLIRNYLFMRIHVEQQEKIYDEYWKPMQDMLNGQLTEYIRHYLMREGTLINQKDIYYSLKAQVTQDNAIDYLKGLLEFARHYKKLLSPEVETDLDIRKYLERLNRIEVTTAYPLLLNFYSDFDERKLKKAEFVEILKILENYLIRRFVCNVPTNSLNKIFPPLYAQVVKRESNNYVQGFKDILQGKGYPKDVEFKTRFKDAKLYGGGDRAAKTKLILETIDESYGHKESVTSAELTIEHIMPQKLSECWQNHLGEEWEVTHELNLHTMGNLTLTGYNQELSNYDFSRKKEFYNNSHLELNKYFNDIEIWNRDAIENRSVFLAKTALEIWPYFGNESYEYETKDVTGTTPIGLRILGQHFKANTWRDVLEQTLNTIADLEPEMFEILKSKFPNLIGEDKKKFRAIRELKNGTYFEVNLSAKDIQKFCYQALETIGLASDDLKVETV